MTDRPVDHESGASQPVPGVHDVEFAEVRAGEALPWDRLETFLRANVPGLQGEFGVMQFPNGSANLTYLVHIGDTKMVVRRPPFGQLAPGAHDMRREFRAVAGLGTVFDRVAKAYAFCDDHEVIGSDFLVVEYRPGVVVWEHVPESMAHHADAAMRIGNAVVDTLADLHAVDPADAGLSELGRPVGFVGRQVGGWRKRWDIVDAGRVPLMLTVSDRLLATMPPESAQVSVLHNDYKIDNCQFDPADPDRVKTIFDWDMATIGDPLVDLGTLLNYWPDPDDIEGDRPLHVPGMEHMGLPSRGAIVERYAKRTGFDVGHVPWYEAFATWKTAVVLEQLYQRWVRGESTDPRMGERGQPVARLAARADAMLDRLSSSSEGANG
jgi:aminoglycoside phosphotransferase (APT) family kinase protein